ncbi:hypothetical protein HMSLTHF_02300 [Vreelandella aquamarina]|uniref:Uncharacterized protein n=1 Tax=Vreelandella aquamarina TaxID=77097 RepID=A0A6F8SPY6_9GAMM|nr:hypothetical protein HMSLTHF_02300 [Halomonas meridiana]
MVKVPVSSAAKPKLMRTALALLSLKAVDVDCFTRFSFSIALLRLNRWAGVRTLG